MSDTLSDMVYQDPQSLRVSQSGLVTVRVIEKPWGHEELLVLCGRYAAKILVINPGERLSVQYHERKIETLYCADGTGWYEYSSRITPDDRIRGDFTPGVTLHLEPDTVHTFGATTCLRLFEVSTPDLEDVVRLEDRYGRSGESR